MTVNPQRVSRLQEHGLTEYESRAYLALLELEKAEASQIADLSRVPRTKIYQALDGLETKKLVKVIPERPKRYLVQPFSNYLDDLEKSLRERAQGLSDQRADLMEEFAPKGNVSMESAGSFITLKGRANIASKMVELFGRAEREVSIATSLMGGHRVAYHADVLEEKAADGVVTNLLCPVGDENRKSVEPVRGFGNVRHALVDLGAVTLIFVDDKEVFLVHHVPDDRHYFQGSDVALWSDDPGIVASLKALYTLSWNLSLEFESAGTVTEAPQPNALLQQLADNLRGALAQAAAPAQA